MNLDSLSRCGTLPSQASKRSGVEDPDTIYRDLPAFDAGI